MTKQIALLTLTTIVILVFIAGCIPEKTESPEPSKAEQPTTEAAQADQPVVALPEAEPPEAEAVETDTAIAEAEPPQTKPKEAEPQESMPPEPEEQITEPEPEPAREAPPAKVEPQKPSPLSVPSFHDNCAWILNNHVDENGNVDYETLTRKKTELKSLLDKFDELDRNKYSGWSKEDKIAFWINAYNLELLRIIIDNYPIKASRIHLLFWPPTSIRHIKGIWNDYKFMVMDEEFTLSEVDRRYLRKEFAEPRIFFAVSHASISSPPLRNEPYYGDRLYKQLDDQIKKFLTGSKGFRISTDKQTVYLSAIFRPNWYGKEFISKYGTDRKFKDQEPATRAVLNFITNYIPKEDVSFLETGNYSIKYLAYDWRLNQ